MFNGMAVTYLYKYKITIFWSICNKSAKGLGCDLAAFKIEREVIKLRV